MRRVIPVMAIVGAFWTAGVIAQGRNFAGNWTIDQERTAAANASAGGGGGAMRGGGGGGGRGGGAVGAVAAGSTTGGTVAVAGGGGGGRGGAAVGSISPAGAGMRSGGAPPQTVISVNASSFTIGVGETAPTTYKTDGSVNTITNAAGQEVKAKASWKGDKLVIETTTETPNGPRSATNTWYLEGEALVRETSRTTADGQAITNKTYFKKG
jgi:hypothetical protein